MRYFLFLVVAAAMLLSAARPQRMPAGRRSGPVAAASAAPTGQLLTSAARAVLFARADLGRLWRHQPQAGADGVFNGCFGYDSQRLEFVFTTVQADAQRPGHYVVAGKYRCYGEVTPFRGSIVLQEVRPLAASAINYYGGTATKGATYYATGQFALQATNTHGLNGQFDGRIGLDFQLPADHRPVLLEATTNPSTRNGGLLFEGSWRNAADGDAVPVLWKQGMAVTHQVLSRFGIGDRSGNINPRYARVGWTSYWANEEWWTEKRVARR